MAHDGGWTGGHGGGVSIRCLASSTMGIRSAMTRGRRAGGIGGRQPRQWAPSVSDGGAVMGGGPAHVRSWAGDQRSVGPTRRKRAETLF
jgi:hypothetical protein